MDVWFEYSKNNMLQVYKSMTFMYTSSLALWVFLERGFPKIGKTRFSQKHFPEHISSKFEKSIGSFDLT